MILKGIAAMLAFTLAGFSGCTKSAAPVASNKSAATAQAAPSKVKDLGVLEMTNHYETCVKFGPDRSCRIVPKMLDRHNIQLTLTLESKNHDGKTSGLSIVQLTGKTQQTFEISVGDTDFSFTPEIADAK
ncbi:MAG TPA: hypothetical protein VMH87_15510 [Pseudomonadales bacterium]|nr:hypothetical protein [Pseudomonadales bacterium]